MTALVRRVPLNSLNLELRSDAIGFIGRLSFEDRSVAAWRSVKQHVSLRSLFFFSDNESRQAKLIRRREKLPTDCLRSVSTSKPLEAYLTINSSISEFLYCNDFDEIVIDITSFRREELLIILKEVWTARYAKDLNIQVVYTTAAEMGSWLSGPVIDVHSIIGFAGSMDPRRNTHLILMLGFEDHRAHAIVDAYEPSRISLGVGNARGAVNSTLHDRNVLTKRYFQRLYGSVYEEFDFSATDPAAAAMDITKVFRIESGMNIVVAPLNTKISTLGAGLVGLRYPQIQMCYASVEEYNIETYSTVGKDCFLISGRLIADFLSET